MRKVLFLFIFPVLLISSGLDKSYSSSKLSFSNHSPSDYLYDDLAGGLSMIECENDNFEKGEISKISENEQCCISLQLEKIFLLPFKGALLEVYFDTWKPPKIS